jgi:hypothetical protein
VNKKTNKAELREVRAEELRTVEGGGRFSDVLNAVAKAVKEVNTWKTAPVSA